MTRLACIVVLLLATIAPTAGARTVRVPWQQNAFVAYRVWDQLGFIPIAGIAPAFPKRVTVHAGSTTYRVLWMNTLFNRQTTSVALRQVRHDATHVPTSYSGVYTDRDLTAAERRRFELLADLARDADVVVVNRDNPVCAAGLTLAQARGIARGTITRWSQVVALPPGYPDVIARHVEGTETYAQPRFGAPKVPGAGVVEPDGGVYDAYANQAVAGITAWSKARAYAGASVCAVPIDGVAPTDTTVFSRAYGPAYPIGYAMTRKRRTDLQGRAMVAAYVAFLRSAAAARLFRENGLLLVADGAPTATAARYRNWDCVWRSGPEYRFTLPGAREWKSRSYILEGFGSSCAFAKKWVNRLARQPYRGGRTPKRKPPTLKHGPPGWRCDASWISPVLKPHTQYTGVCQNRRDNRRVFSWGPQSGDDEPVVVPTPSPDVTPVPEETPAPDPGTATTL